MARDRNNGSAGALTIALLLATSMALALDTNAGDITISATYLEDVTYVDSQFSKGQLPWWEETQPGTQSGMTLVRSVLGVPLGTHKYLIAAADYLGNPAVYEEIVRAGGSPGISVISPSSIGMAESPLYDMQRTILVILLDYS